MTGSASPIINTLLALCDDQGANPLKEDVRLDDSSLRVEIASVRRPRKPGVQLGRGGIKANICSIGDLIRLMMVNEGSYDLLRSSFGMILVVSATLADGIFDDDRNCRLATSEACTCRKTCHILPVPVFIASCGHPIKPIGEVHTSLLASTKKIINVRSIDELFVWTS